MWGLHDITSPRIFDKTNAENLNPFCQFLWSTMRAKLPKYFVYIIHIHKISIYKSFECEELGKKENSGAASMFLSRIRIVLC